MATMRGAVKRMDCELERIVSVIDKNEVQTGRPTIIVLTTYHGIDMPDNKGTLTDRGLGVFLLIRAPGMRPARVTESGSQIGTTPTVRSGYREAAARSK